MLSAARPNVDELFDRAHGLIDIYFVFITYRSETLCVAPRRRGGRVVECTALEMRHTGNRIGGSNPSLSARERHQLIDQ
jgi:hypothetical protein